MKEVICQSCGTPLVEEEQFGTNADQSYSEDYCIYCYENGEFRQDVDMEGMIHICAQFFGEWEPKVTREEAIEQMREFFPTLKRWKN